jgi:uncharacterized protein (TIGR02453 family)
MAFSERTTEFLFENRVTDSKLWFEQHRAEYEDLVLEPLRQLVRDLTPTMLEIDPFFCCEPKIGKCISRIFRDTRYTRDKHVFRDAMWISFARSRITREGGMPGFFFEVSPRGLLWGCGWFQASPEAMAVLRERALAGDKRFLACQRLLKKRPDFYLSDERYKRSKYPQAPEALREWLDLKNVCLLAGGDVQTLLPDPALPDVLAKDFKAMKPLYDFLSAVESAVPKREGEQQPW